MLDRRWLVNAWVRTPATLAMSIFVVLPALVACSAPSCPGPACATSSPESSALAPPTPAPLVPLAVASTDFTIPISLDLTTQLLSPLTGSLDSCGTLPRPVVAEPVMSGRRMLQLSAGGEISDPSGVVGSNRSSLLAFTVAAAETQPVPSLPPTTGATLEVAGSTEMTKAIADALTGLTLDDAVPIAKVSAGVNLADWYTYLKRSHQRSSEGVLNFSLPNRCGVYNLVLELDLQ